MGIHDAIGRAYLSVGVGLTTKQEICALGAFYRTISQAAVPPGNNLSEDVTPTNEPQRTPFFLFSPRQDGSYLAEFLLEKGYCVHGIIRRSSSFNTARIDHIFDKAGMMGDD